MDLSRFMHCVLEPFATPCRDMLSKTFKRNAFQETPNSVCVCARTPQFMSATHFRDEEHSVFQHMYMYEPSSIAQWTVESAMSRLTRCLHSTESMNLA